MFRKWFGPKQDSPAEKVTAPEAPFSVGQITNLIESRVDFQVEGIVKSEFCQNQWEAHGKAIVHLPTNATDIQIDPIINKYGAIRTYAISYTSAGKKHLFNLARDWNHTDGDTDEVICELSIDEVEV